MESLDRFTASHLFDGDNASTAPVESEGVAAWVATSRSRQDLPEKVEDPSALTCVAALLSAAAAAEAHADRPESGGR